MLKILVDKFLFFPMLIWRKIKPRRMLYRDGYWVTEIFKNGSWVEDATYEVWLKTART